MTFEGLDEIVESMNKKNKDLLFYLFRALLQLGMDCILALLDFQRHILRTNLSSTVQSGFRQTISKITQPVRRRMHPMKTTLRRIIELKRTKQKAIIGFISDQAPKWNSIHHWTEFLNQETPVFIGTEKIGKQVDALIYYADVTRVKRGYYHCRLKPLCDTPRQVPDFELTDLFTRELEQTIKAHPQYWLWSHNRWKRTKEEWLRRQQEETK